MWVFERKGRVTSKSAATEEHFLYSRQYPHIIIEDNEVFNKVGSVAERFQILQHAIVYNLGTIVLAIADNQAELISSTVVGFSTKVKERFEKVLKGIKEHSLSWAYPDDRNLCILPRTQFYTHKSWRDVEKHFYRSRLTIFFISTFKRVHLNLQMKIL